MKPKAVHPNKLDPTEKNYRSLKSLVLVHYVIMLNLEESELHCKRKSNLPV